MKRSARSVEPAFDVQPHLAGPAGLLAAAANVILQLSRPEVGHGVVESTVDSGNVMIHPWKRLRTTSTYLVVALLGNEEDRRTFRDAVNRSHVPVHSGPDSPVAYNAFDRDLQLWVAACLYVGLRDLREQLLGSISADDAEGLFRYCRRLGTTLQVTDDQWPADLAAFDEYWRDGLSRARIDEPVRVHLRSLIALEMIPRWMRIVTARVNTFFTAGFLPPDIRDQLGLDWGPRQQRRFDRSLAVIRFANRLTPTWLLCLPFWLQLWEFRMRRRLGWRLT